MKVQVSICDPNNSKLFHPIDKVIVYKKEDKVYCTASFCGYDYSDLNDGIYLGDKVICPTCGTTYNMTDGIVDSGASLRNISSFPCQIRKNMISIIVPDHIPAFALREGLKSEKMDPRTYVIIGDSEAALSALVTLRYSYSGRIVLIPTSSYGSFENKDVFYRKFGPLQKDEVYMVENDLFDKACIEIKTAKIDKIDHDQKVIVFQHRGKDSKQEYLEYDSILFAGSASKLNPLKQFSNVYQITDFESHAKVYNAVLKANHVVIHGKNFEAFQLASSIRKRLDEIKFNDIKLTILYEDFSELAKTFGPVVTARLYLDYITKLKVNIISGAHHIKIRGDTRLKEFRYYKKNNIEQEFYIDPDVVIYEGGLGKVDHKLADKIFMDRPKYKVKWDEND